MISAVVNEDIYIFIIELNTLWKINKLKSSFKKLLTAGQTVKQDK